MGRRASSDTMDETFMESMDTTNSPEISVANNNDNDELKILQNIKNGIEVFGGENGNDAHQEFMVKRFQDFPAFIGIHCFKTYENLTIVINSMINLVSNLTNITYVVKLSQELVFWSENTIKLVSFGTYLIIVILVIEPEKLKYLTIITTVLFMGISKSK